MRRRSGDPGLQPERTLLSWQRTVALIIVVALLYVRDPFQSGGSNAVAGLDPPQRVAVAALAVVVSGVLIAHVRRRWRACGNEGRDGGVGWVVAPLARPWALFFVSAGVAGFGVVIAAGAVLD
ncbi:uncharacterized membrane protein YidH (DUF202 family) [Lipingzhangella halophila]|uniref:Uncharacterized membrane protein YidH (DUF202 family) n=1 Tax=Lipingzhangella halophila TaxID=1783352 RepID=A0A7W7W4Z1_9ACTN|nr:DUF202 domain-containing protein [Lipingzhangella halophila]MBB4934306.1 uncharacterized membrane protein YidH (DUF202 family) [Lipingzhangella halophila]